MAQNGRVHPNCVNANNPYHECGMYCLEKIAQGQGQKEKKKSSKYSYFLQVFFVHMFYDCAIFLEITVD